MLTGITSDLFWRRMYNRLVQRNEAQGGGSEPEFRLPATIVGAFVVPVALFGKLLQVFWRCRDSTNGNGMQGLGGPRIPQ